MADNGAVIGPIRAWLRSFDPDGSGIASTDVLEPALTQLLGFKEKDMKKLLKSFQSGQDSTDYEALLAFIFDVPIKRESAPRSNNQDAWVEAPSSAATRSAELAWLHDLAETVPDHVKKALVSHRGFHCSSDRPHRPVENTLPAYEQAWSSGVINCECDIQVTADGYLVLNHDEDLSRLAMALGCKTKSKHHKMGISDLTLKQLISLPMKSGVRQPLLKEVLESAVSLETAQLVIEVKPGGQNIAEVLVDFFQANPTYLKHVPVVMSFDASVVFRFAELFPSHLPRPKVLLLTCKRHKTHPLKPHETLLDFEQGDVRADVAKLIKRNGVQLDGVYVEWTEKLLGKSKEWLQKLCETCTVGMWQNAGEPDCLQVGIDLSALGVSFVNTDFPKGYMREYVGKVQHEDRLPDSLFASITPAADGNAGGEWKQRPSRAEQIKTLKETEYDILVIGGGATGMGVALEATRQGYKVALVERGDWACGTSSKSSNMIHGGIRYLQAFVNNPDGAQEQINVVKKGLAEQTYMYNCAPYCVRPCPFMVAVYDDKEKDNYGKLLAKYDDLGDDDPFPESNWNTKKETLFRFPHLRQDGLMGSYIYYDGQQDDARMATLIGLTAIEGGATICNYLDVTSLIKEGGISKGVVLTDTDSKDGVKFNVRAKVVVNATGPFTDAILKLDSGPTTPNIIKPAAGTHVVLPDHFSPDRTGLAILETSDGRAIFYLPWMGQTIVGTTDWLSEIKPQLAPPLKDIEWIIKEVNRYLNPDHTPAKHSDVLSAWVGIRPLAQGLASATGTKDAGPAGGGDTKSVPREHAVMVSDSKVVTITGGKWTSYRHMAEDTLKEVIALGGLKPLLRPYTEGKPAFEQGFVGTKAGPNKDYSKLDLACAAPFHADVVELRKKWHFPREVAENLIHSYGTHAIEVACIARRGEEKGYAKRIAEGYPWIMAQVVYACRREYACSVPDVLSRRTRLAQVDVLAAYDAISEIVDVMAQELGWGQERVMYEVSNAGVFLESCGLEFCRKQRLHC